MLKNFFCSLLCSKEQQTNPEINYLINDPSTPHLSAKVTLPQVELLKFQVKNFSTNPKNYKEQQALNCYVTIGNCINYVQKNAKNHIKKWASTSSLQIIPQAGKDLNAYYDRTNLKFFYYPIRGKTMSTADSSDVVAHELGHALLDAVRPDFWSVQALEIWSFHEAFSDIVSIVSIMQYDNVLNDVLSKSLDISKSNEISRLAEEFGTLIYHLVGHKNKNLPNCLRDPAIQKFKYVDPSFLPQESLDDELCAECHSFGRVFSAAWYEIFANIYKLELKKNSPIQALKNARDISFSTLMQAIPNSPRVVQYYSAIAKSMVNVAKIKHPEYAQIINEIFIDWNIIKPIKFLSNTEYKDVIYNLSKNDEVIKNSKHTLIRIVNNKTIKLNNISILSNNKLNNVEIEVPADKYYEFDSNGNLVDEIEDSEDQINNSISICVKEVEKSIGKMWVINDGKLVRKYIS
jgi:hypothetical protein